ncbi:dihydrofolate reductase family protein [Jiangella gansuensis]|uniref:dihydrofolate reductase family protein n=1 Tax=Jiangella gansuensis TaxID=281473 RepID=UPI00047BD147|nr:dihydrofolate reductase family protein [Jiangella gansuensis]
MTKVVYDMSMSLDGFVTAAGITADEPLGAGGERLHSWAFPGADERSAALVKQGQQSLGAMITGRTTYDASLRWWGPDGPTGANRVPLYVVTHRETPRPADGSVYTFVTDGIDSAVKQAKATAGDKNVAISGVSVGSQLIQAGYVDELVVHVVPLLFGDGVRFYDHVGGDHVDLELIEAIPTPHATHLHYRVVGRRDPTSG